MHFDAVKIFNKLTFKRERPDSKFILIKINNKNTLDKFIKEFDSVISMSNGEKLSNFFTRLRQEQVYWVTLCKEKSSNTMVVVKYDLVQNLTYGNLTNEIIYWSLDSFLQDWFMFTKVDNRIYPIK